MYESKIEVDDREPVIQLGSFGLLLPIPLSQPIFLVQLITLIVFEIGFLSCLAAVLYYNVVKAKRIPWVIVYGLFVPLVISFPLLLESFLQLRNTVFLLNAVGCVAILVPRFGELYYGVPKFAQESLQIVERELRHTPPR